MMFNDSFWGLQGFDELRKHVKQGAELCKDILVVLQERADLELSYSKGLGKLANKLTRVTQSGVGTLAEAWGLVGTEMETEAEQHKQLSQAINDEVCKSIKNLYETQKKARQPIEVSVDKCARTLADRRDVESKSRKSAANAAKEREKAYSDLSRDVKNKEKDLPKLEKKVRLTEEQCTKADREYLESCKKLELAREEWESNIYKAASQFQVLEQERITQMQDYLDKYNSHLSVIGPKLIKSCDKLGEAVLSVSAEADIEKVIQLKGNGPRQSEQVLPEYYAEDVHSNTMDCGRRKQTLQTLIELIDADIDREQKALDGVEKLVEVYRNRPSFADNDTREEVNQRQANVAAMLQWLAASRDKLACALANVEGQPRSPSQFAPYIEQSKDKQGHTTTVLKIRSPSMDASPSSTSVTLRPPLQSRNAISTYDIDEFEALGQCTAVYAYAAKQYDELTIQPGDVIMIHEKLQDGWWQGELDGKVGIFPSNYVTEMT